MPAEVHFCSLASPIMEKPRFSARLIAPWVAISEAMLSVRPLPTARNPRQSLAPGGTAGAAIATAGRSANRPTAASPRTHDLDLDIYPSNACAEALGPSGRKLLPERDDLKTDGVGRLWIIWQLWLWS